MKNTKHSEGTRSKTSISKEWANIKIKIDEPKDYKLKRMKIKWVYDLLGWNEDGTNRQAE